MYPPSGVDMVLSEKIKYSYLCIDKLTNELTKNIFQQLELLRY